LRQHHTVAGVQDCTACHSDANPASYTPVGEDILPKHYAVPGSNHPKIPSNSCNVGGVENFAGTSLGLDNDGDNSYDAADSNCTVIVTFSVGGNVSGLAGSGLALQNSGFDTLPIAANGSFTFATELNDAWFNPATNGQGFLITAFPDIGEMFLAWFTFDTQRPSQDVTAMLGEPGHRWLTAQGPYNGDTANLIIYVTEGGVFDAVEPEATTDPAGDGTMTIEFADCINGLVSYEITSLGISGEIPIQRIAPDNVALCETLSGQ